jgi:hypothetical protein
MMRILIAASLAASLVSTNLMAADLATNAPLSPGKAAGVQKAEAEDMPLLWIALGIGAAAGLALSQENPASIQSTISA